MTRSPIRHVLLIHGAGAGGWEWNVWREVLYARGFVTCAPDLQPAAGGLAATRLDDYRDQVGAALAGLPRPCALIGASLGGLLAMLCADRADALVLINPLPPAPWAAQLPARDWPEVVPWRRDARLGSTRRAVPDADEAAAVYALRRWRDESGAVLRRAYAGVEALVPAGPVLCIASEADEDVAARTTAQFAEALSASVWPCPRSSHAGPLLGRQAARTASAVADWLSAR